MCIFYSLIREKFRDGYESERERAKARGRASKQVTAANCIFTLYAKTY